ncbi:MAG: hypothetical protein UW72_C0003G0002 [Parcubacteria group bacterium GW2011_GWF2_44_7]|nr:MAG: hypothetical protein UW72_C0003G0002 [Parcubacteria group bacterium GW2011_GWF2_44_7]
MNERKELFLRMRAYIGQAGQPGTKSFELRKDDRKNLDKIISNLLEKPTFQPVDLGILFICLYMLHDINPADYLTQSQRNVFIKKVSNTKPVDLDNQITQIRTLKYCLGINKAEELDAFGSVLPVFNFLNEFNWETLIRIDGYFEIINFFGLKHPSEINQSRIDELTKATTSRHFFEHGLNNVPVYVDDSSRAKNQNESYHCLFFKE